MNVVLLLAVALSLPKEIVDKLEASRKNLDAFCQSKAKVMVSNEDLQAMRKVSEALSLVGRGMSAEEIELSGVDLARFADFGLADPAVTPLTSVECPADIRRGDLVFRSESGGCSRYFLDASRTQKRFSHVGVVLTVGETVKIADVADDGRFVAVDWARYFSTAFDGAVYRHVGMNLSGIGERIARAAEKRIGTPFDPAFDLKTKDRLYCTEMVRDCVNEAAGREVIGTSRKGDFEYVAVDDCYRNEMTKVWDCRDQKPEEKQTIQKLQSRPVVIESASTTNAPVRRTIRFIPKNR